MKKNLLILLMISSLTYADEYKPDWIPISEGEKAAFILIKIRCIMMKKAGF